MIVAGASAFFAVSHLSAVEKPRESGIDPANFDKSIKPGDDFFDYVNGNWNKQNPIPPEYSRWGAFPKLRDDNLNALHQIVEGLSQKNSLDENERKIRDLYATAMNEAKLQEEGAKPLEPELAKIAAINSRDELIAVVG